MAFVRTKHNQYSTIVSVPHSKSGLVPRSSFSGAGHLGFRGTGKGGTMGERGGK